jgi:hypothetical protein
VSDRTQAERDHDELIELRGIVKRQEERIVNLEEDNRTLMSDRAKLLGWCGGVAAAVTLLLKYFLPK